VAEEKGGGKKQGQKTRVTEGGEKTKRDNPIIKCRRNRRGSKGGKSRDFFRGGVGGSIIRRKGGKIRWLGEEAKESQRSRHRAKKPNYIGQGGKAILECQSKRRGVGRGRGNGSGSPGSGRGKGEGSVNDGPAWVIKGGGGAQKRRESGKDVEPRKIAVNSGKRGQEIS